MGCQSTLGAIIPVILLLLTEAVILFMGKVVPELFCYNQGPSVLSGDVIPITEDFYYYSVAVIPLWRLSFQFPRSYFQEPSFQLLGRQGHFSAGILLLHLGAIISPWGCHSSFSRLFFLRPSKYNQHVTWWAHKER